MEEPDSPADPLRPHSPATKNHPPSTSAPNPKISAGGSGFSLITWLPTESAAMPPQDQADFLVAAAEMMTPLPYVERWAWFSLTPPPYAPNVATYDDQGALTSVGREFQQLT